jgi:small subunit ribosomal protein S3Ae
MVQKAVPKTSRKIKDKWRTKDWYSILAPDMFDRAKIGETLSDDPQKLIGRIVEVTAQDLTGDFTKIHIKLHFRVDEIRENEAHTSFLRQDLTSDYVRRLARRKRTRIEETFLVTTRDKMDLRIRPVAITEQRIQSSNQSSLRKVLGEELKKIASESLLQDFLKNLISGQLSKRLAQACKHINLINRIEIRKTENISVGVVKAETEPEEPVVESPEAKEPEAEAPEGEEPSMDNEVAPEEPEALNNDEPTETIPQDEDDNLV